MSLTVEGLLPYISSTYRNAATRGVQGKSQCTHSTMHSGSGRRWKFWQGFLRQMEPAKGSSVSRTTLGLLEHARLSSETLNARPCLPCMDIAEPTGLCGRFVLVSLVQASPPFAVREHVSFGGGGAAFQWCCVAILYAKGSFRKRRAP